MTIEMIPLTPEYLPEVSGKYLVQTRTQMGNKQFLQAKVTLHEGGRAYAIDVTNQSVTHISTKPIL